MSEGSSSWKCRTHIALPYDAKKKSFDSPPTKAMNYCSCNGKICLHSTDTVCFLKCYLFCDLAMFWPSEICHFDKVALVQYINLWFLYWSICMSLHINKKKFCLCRIGWHRREDGCVPDLQLRPDLRLLWKEKLSLRCIPASGDTLQELQLNCIIG
jgi:hypothetical protein